LTTNSKIIVDTYGTNAPAAAKFGVGATTLEEINQATEARRRLVSEQSDTKTGPVRRT
jgi:hypothetical protein